MGSRKPTPLSRRPPDLRWRPGLAFAPFSLFSIVLLLFSSFLFFLLPCRDGDNNAVGGQLISIQRDRLPVNPPDTSTLKLNHQVSWNTNY